MHAVNHNVSLPFLLLVPLLLLVHAVHPIGSFLVCSLLLLMFVKLLLLQLVLHLELLEKLLELLLELLLRRGQRGVRRRADPAIRLGALCRHALCRVDGKELLDEFLSAG